MDAKKSPLALLAQTCSQIGADSAAVKPTGSSEKNKVKVETSKSPTTTSKTPKSNISPQEIRPLAFKPYELSVYNKTLILPADDDRLSSNSCSANGSVSEENLKSRSARVPSRSGYNSSPEISVVNKKNNRENGFHTPNASDSKSLSPNVLLNRTTSPIIRLGMEVLQGAPKDKTMGSFRPVNFGMNPLVSLCCPPGLEQNTINPAFRPTFADGYSHQHAAMLAAVAAGYSSSATNNPSSFITYARVKTPSGGETIIPICKDPYCTGCQYSSHNQHMLLGVSCPNGCTQCEQQKYGYPMAMSSNPYPQLNRLYICNWIIGESYCGKRCASPDELIQHLRTHTPNLTDPTASAVLLQIQQQAMLPPTLRPIFSSQIHCAGYSTPPLSPMPTARFHPYKSGTPLPTVMPPSPYTTFNPTSLGAYYSPYTIYSQKLGTAAAHH